MQTAPASFVTARLRAERFTRDHVDELAMLDTDAAVNATLFGRTYERDETRTRVARRVAFWTERGYGDYIVRLPDGTFVGTAGLFPGSNGNEGSIALGYALRPDFWGAGYATELARELVGIARAFGAPVIAYALETNARSRRVLEKAGFVCAGVNADDPETVLYRLVP